MEHGEWHESSRKTRQMETLGVCWVTTELWDVRYPCSLQGDEGALLMRSMHFLPKEVHALKETGHMHPALGKPVSCWSPNYIQLGILKTTEVLKTTANGVRGASIHTHSPNLTPRSCVVCVRLQR